MVSMLRWGCGTGVWRSPKYRNRHNLLSIFQTVMSSYQVRSRSHSFQSMNGSAASTADDAENRQYRLGQLLGDRPISQADNAISTGRARGPSTNHWRFYLPTENIFFQVGFEALFYLFPKVNRRCHRSKIPFTAFLALRLISTPPPLRTKASPAKILSMLKMSPVIISIIFLISCILSKPASFTRD